MGYMQILYYLRDLLEYPGILVSERGTVTHPPWILRDNCSHSVTRTGPGQQKLLLCSHGDADLLARGDPPRCNTVTIKKAASASMSA